LLLFTTPPPPTPTLFPYTTLFRSHSYIPRPAVTGGGGKYVGGFGAQVQYADLDFPHHASRVRGFGAAFKAEVKRLQPALLQMGGDRKSTRLNSSHVSISYAVFCLK